MVGTFPVVHLIYDHFVSALSSVFHSFEVSKRVRHVFT